MPPRHAAGHAAQWVKSAFSLSPPHSPRGRRFDGSTRPRTALGSPAMILDLERLRAAPLIRDPFDFVVVEEFVVPDALPRLIADFPAVRGHGSYPLPTLSYGAG